MNALMLSRPNTWIIELFYWRFHENSWFCVPLWNWTVSCL